jgi:hypothetical protein
MCEIDALWEVLGWAFLGTVVLGVLVGVRVWLTPPTPTGVVSVAGLVAFVVLGWTQGNRIAEHRWREPVNWPLQLRFLSEYPGVGDGACHGFIEPGLYASPGSRFEDPVEEEVTVEEAARHNASARACRARAVREGRDRTPGWAGWASILILGIVAIAGYDHWGRRM